MWVTVKAVFLLGAGTDVMQYHEVTGWSALIADDHDVGKILRDQTGDQVAGLKAFWVITMGMTHAFAGEVGDQIGHSAVIDIAIRGFQPPVLGIGGKILFHVEMHQYLQVVTASSQRPNHHIGAHAAIWGDIAQGVVEFHVIGHICLGHAYLRARGQDKFLRERILCGNGGIRQQQRETKGRHQRSEAEQEKFEAFHTVGYVKARELWLTDADH